MSLVHCLTRLSLPLAGLSLAFASAARAAAGDQGLLAQDLTDFIGYPAVAGERSFSASATWCNRGGTQLAWEGRTNQHPISVLNLYRIENGRMVQIGASWATHQLCALQLGECGDCEPAGAGCAFALGIGCSTNSTAISLGLQSNMSRRSEVDAASADFPFPFTNPPVASDLERRCRVKVEDIDTALHPNAIYLFELMCHAKGEGNFSPRHSDRRGERVRGCLRERGVGQHRRRRHARADRAGR
jgi:hypothetical protein